MGVWEAMQRDCSADKLFQTDEAVELEACCADTDARGGRCEGSLLFLKTDCECMYLVMLVYPIFATRAAVLAQFWECNFVRLSVRHTCAL